jgi:hypothetical protein
MIERINAAAEDRERSGLNASALNLPLLKR